MLIFEASSGFLSSLKKEGEVLTFSAIERPLGLRAPRAPGGGSYY